MIRREYWHQKSATQQKPWGRMDSDKTKSYFDWEDNDSHGHNAPVR